jgi:hypothetical protein
MSSRTTGLRKWSYEEAQKHFDFLMPYGEQRKTLRTAEVAKCFERSTDFILGLIDEGKLEALSAEDRTRETYRITRRSVLLELAAQARFEPDFFIERLLRVIDALTPEQCEAVIKRATARRAKL